jgi:hypothetical protein
MVDSVIGAAESYETGLIINKSYILLHPISMDWSFDVLENSTALPILV